MKCIAGTTAALLLTAAPLFAQDVAPVNDGIVAETDWSQLIRTRDITGSPVYTTNEAHDEGAWGDRENYAWGWTGYDGVGADWTQVGEIEDTVLGRSGQLVGVVVEVGGFLDIGDKHVMLRVDEIDLVAAEDRSYSMITRFSEEQLEQLPGVDEGWWE